MTDYRERMEDYEIDVKDLLYRIALQWRQMLTAFLICGTLFGVYSGLKSYQSVKNAEIALAEQKKQGGPKEGEEAVVVPELQIINITNIVVGGIVGALFVAFIPAYGYIMSKKLRHEDDLVDVFDVHVLAAYPNNKRFCKKNSKVDMAIYHVFWKDENAISEKDRMNLAVTDCVMSTAQKGYKSVCFISSVSDDSQYVNEIVDMLSHVVKTCVLEKSITSSAKSLQTIPQYDCVVVVEKIDKSFYEDIIRELEYCDRFNVPVLGSIIVG